MKHTTENFQRLFQKFFTREIPLIVMEYWWKGEYEALPKRIKGATHFNPLFVRNQDGRTSTYYDMNNPEAALQSLFDFFIERPTDFDCAVKDFKVYQQKVGSLIADFSQEKFEELFNTIVD